MKKNRVYDIVEGVDSCYGRYLEVHTHKNGLLFKIFGYGRFTRHPHFFREYYLCEEDKEDVIATMQISIDGYINRRVEKSKLNVVSRTNE